MRSRVTLNSLPTSSSVRCLPSSRPKRRRSTLPSLSVSVPSTSSSCSLRSICEAASAGAGASSSGIKSPRWLSSSSPIGVSSETGSWEIRIISRTLSSGSFNSSAISSAVASRPCAGACCLPSLPWLSSRPCVRVCGWFSPDPRSHGL